MIIITIKVDEEQRYKDLEYIFSELDSLGFEYECEAK